MNACIQLHCSEHIVREVKVTITHFPLNCRIWQDRPTSWPPPRFSKVNTSPWSSILLFPYVWYQCRCLTVWSASVVEMNVFCCISAGDRRTGIHPSIFYPYGASLVTPTWGNFSSESHLPPISIKRSTNSHLGRSNGIKISLLICFIFICTCNSISPPNE